MDRDSGILTLGILSIAQLFGLSLWFATNSVIDQLIPEFGLNPQDLTWLSIAVTLGFVFGGLTSTLTNISDIAPADRVFMISSLLGGAATAIIALKPDFVLVLVLRFLTGFFLAGIYPVGMKLTASHFKKSRGLAIGTLLSALTIGSGLPYIFLIFGTPSWQVVLLTVATLAVLGGLLVGMVVEVGPFVGPPVKFSIDAVKKIFSNNSVKYANLGYNGHMWELYAFWVWYPRMLKASLEASGLYSEAEVIRLFATGSFLVFLLGGLANIGGGYAADRIGRSKFNIVMLSLSGLSGLLIGFFFSSPIMVLVVGLIWGITIIPDSPQYSSMITEVSDQSLVGSALAIQTAIGFLLTIITIYTVPLFVEIVGWSYAFMYLALGPVIGIVAMIRLRRQPDAVAIANGLM